jgi:hypothetical protein
MFEMAFLPGTWDRERLLGFLVLLGVGLYSLVLLLKRLAQTPPSPDPWDAETASRVEDADAPVLCHRCLVPNNPGADFCENCGAAVGEYTNYLPYPYVFSLGHILRVGTAGEFRRSPVTVLGFILLAVAVYKIFAPVYLVFFFRNLPKKESLAQPIPPG